MMTRGIGRGFLVLVTATLTTMTQAADPERVPIPEDWAGAAQWRSIGPANMGGRITSLAVYEADPCIWWAATASGGLLKTTNDGTSFVHQFDGERTVSVGAVAVAQSNPEIVWVGTGESNPRNSVSWGDGVYKSVDGGATWENMGLGKSFQIGAVVVHPEDPDVVYVGALGRLWGPSEERGLYKTTDGGATWERLLFVDDRTGVIDIDMNPSEPDTLLVATYERERDGFDTNDPSKRFGSGAAIWRTTDGGANFEKVTEGLPTCNLGRIGIDYYRADPNVVYAVIESEKIGAEPENAPYMGIRGEDAEVGAKLTQIIEAGPAAEAGLVVGDIVIAIEDDIVHSYDGLIAAIRKRIAGDTVMVTVSRKRKSVEKELTFAQRPGEREDEEGPGAQRNQGSELFPATRRRFGGSDASNPFGTRLGGQITGVEDRQGPDGFEYGGIYRSDDGGVSWTRINSLNPRPMYFSELRVDPSDNQHIYLAGISLYRSKDGGKTFTGDGGRGVHVDHHAMWIDPNDGRHIILGNDGGIYVTRDRMSGWDHLNHVAIGQFYHVGVGPRDNYRVYGGLQDNGSWGGPSRTRDGTGAVNADWFRVGGGDGFICRVDPNDPDLVYFESQNGALGRRHLTNGERGSMRPRAPRGTRYRFNWKTPYVLSSHNSGIYYSAGNFVFQSVHRGDGLRAISPEITNTRRGSATALAESPFDRDTMWVGTDDGALWSTRDGGSTWTKLDGAPELAPEEPEDDAAEETPAQPDAQVEADAAAPVESIPAAKIVPMEPAPEAVEAEPAREADPEAEPEDPVAGRWIASAIGSELSFVLELEREEDTVTGTFRGDEGVAALEGGTYAARERRIEGTLIIGGMTMQLRATVQGSGMTGTLGAAGGMFALAFEATRETKARLAAAPVDPIVSRILLASLSATAQDEPVSGTWRGRSQQGGGGGDGGFTLVLKRASEDTSTVTGTIDSPMHKGPISNGNFEDGKLTFTVEMEMMAITFSATIEGNRMQGTLGSDDGMFSMEFEATQRRRPGAGRRARGSGERGRGGGPRPAAAPSDDPPSSEDGGGRPLGELMDGPRWVSSLEASRHVDGRVYVTFDGHRSNDDRPHAFMSEDHGGTWRSLTADLPEHVGSTRVLREDRRNENLLYLGTEFGFYVSIDRGTTWTRLHGNLPTVAIHEVAQHPTLDEIVVGTHGRSLWILNVAALRQMSAATVGAMAHLYQPDDVMYWHSMPSRGATNRRFVGTNPPATAGIWVSFAEDVRRAELRIRDGRGEVVRSLEVPTTAGLHRLTWDLRRQADAAPGSGGGPGQRGRFRRAPRVDPGVYQVELTVGNQRQLASISVRPDPEFPEVVLWGEEYEERLAIEAELEAGDEVDELVAPIW